MKQTVDEFYAGSVEEQIATSTTTTLPAIRIDSEQGLQIPDEATVAQRMLLQLFMNTPTALWDVEGEQVIRVTGIIVYDDFKRDTEGNYIYADDTPGELIPCKRSLWLCENGDLYTSASPVVYGFVKKLLALWGVQGQHGMLLNPVNVEVKHKRTKKGRPTFDLRMVV